MSVSLNSMVNEKERICKKISDLNNILRESDCDHDDVINELSVSVEKYLSLSIKIASIRGNVTININGNETDLSTANMIVESIKLKIDYLTSIIKNKNCSVQDRIKYIRDREKEMESLDFLSHHISLLELTVEV
mgnify:CR=1 FL=1